MFLGDPNLEVTDKGQVLRIRSARLGDGARYQCSVSNAAGKLLKDFSLSVYGEPPPPEDAQWVTLVDAFTECEGILTS